MAMKIGKNSIRQFLSKEKLKVFLVDQYMLPEN
jgi:hypothetical protein